MPDDLALPSAVEPGQERDGVRALRYSLQVICPSPKCSFSSASKVMLAAGIEPFLNRCIRTHSKLHRLCDYPRLFMTANFEEADRAETPVRHETKNASQKEN
jgi:hypothetical protein